MPTYDYECPACGGFDALRSVSDRDEPCACPACGEPSRRVWARAPRLSALTTGTRLAHERNERAAHEPVSSGDYARLRHPPGCGCCRPGGASATRTLPNGVKTFAGKRPWMISH